MSKPETPYAHILAETYLANRALEQHLLQIEFDSAGVNGGLLNYSDLPEEFDAGGIEEYSNDLASATTRDVNGEERGGWIHLRQNPRMLLYPVTPAIGVTVVGHGRIENTVQPETYIDDTVYPLVFDHSHPDTGTFSPIDLSLAVGDDQPVWPVMTIAATRQFNYLLLRTHESHQVSWEGLKHVLLQSLESTAGEAQRYGERMTEMAVTDFEKYELYLDVFNGDAREFYQTLMQTQAVADVCKLGFYFSERDGIYRLCSSLRIRERMVELFDQA